MYYQNIQILLNFIHYTKILQLLIVEVESEHFSNEFACLFFYKFWHLNSLTIDK